MPPRQDLVIQVERVQVQTSRPPPPPPPGRLQRPPHDHPAVYIDRSTTRPTNNNARRT